MNGPPSLFLAIVWAGCVDAPPDAPAPPVVLRDALGDLPQPPSRAAPTEAASLDGVRFDLDPGAVMRSCAPVTFPRGRALTFPTPITDLDGDGTPELVLLNQTCPDAAGVAQAHAVLRWSIDDGALVVAGSLLDHLSDAAGDAVSLTEPVDSATFVDVDDDGDADLVGVLTYRSTAVETDAREPLWRQTSPGVFHAAGTPDPDGPQAPGVLHNAGGVGVVDLGLDRQLELVVPYLPAFAPVRLAWISRLADAPPLVELDRFRRDPPAVGWAISPLQGRDGPWSQVFVSANGVATDFDLTWSVPTGEDLGATFFDATTDPVTGAPIDALFFQQPDCAARSPVCLTPMGATSALLQTDDGSAPQARCSRVSTGQGNQPVAVFCEDDAGERWTDRGSLAQALRFFEQPGELTLAWQIDTGWDLDANGLLDVVVTAGHDATVDLAMPLMAWLQEPACYAATCRRYTSARLEAVGLGHRHGLQRVPVRLRDGSEALLVVTSSSQQAGPGATEAWTWQPPPRRRWVALQLGARHDLWAVGSRIEVTWTLPPATESPAAPPATDDRTAPPRPPPRARHDVDAPRQQRPHRVWRPPWRDRGQRQADRPRVFGPRRGPARPPTSPPAHRRARLCRTRSFRRRGHPAPVDRRRATRPTMGYPPPMKEGTRSARRWARLLLAGGLAVGACDPPRDAPPPLSPDPPSPDAAPSPPRAPRPAPQPPSSEPTPADTYPPPTAEDPAPPQTWPTPSLLGATFDPTVGDALRACVTLDMGGVRPVHLPAPAVDLDDDGEVELALFNMSCPDDAGGWVDHPLLRFDPATARLRVVGSLLDRWGDPRPSRPFGAAGFADLDGDGDADLLAPAQLTDDSQAIAWLHNNAGELRPRPFTVLDGGDAQPSFYEAALGFVDVDQDGVVEGIAPFRGPDEPPSEGRFGLVDVGPRGGVGVTSRWLEGTEGRIDWAVGPFSLDPERDPWSWTWIAQSLVPSTSDDLFRSADGAALADTTIDAQTDPLTGAPIDATLFLQPICGSRSPSCLTPMGGASMWLPDDPDAGGPLPPTWTSCLLVSTGIAMWPVGVFCDDGGGARLRERGAVVDALAQPPLSPATLAWQVVTTWDVNADGWDDLLVTNGRDAGTYDPMPTFAYLQTPGCQADACPRWAADRLPLASAHHTALERWPVRGADGAWRILGFLSTDAHPTDPSITLEAFLWAPPPDHHWVALQIGSRHDLRAVGATIHAQRFDAADQPIAGTERTLHTLQATRATPGANSPVILGLSPGTARLHLEIDLPRCHPTITLDLTAFDQPVPIDVPPCP
jgi:hypothetical protein